MQCDPTNMTYTFTDVDLNLDQVTLVLKITLNVTARLLS